MTYFMHPVRSGEVWSSMTTSSLPESIPNANTSYILPRSLFEYRIPRWGNNNYPYLTFFPLQYGFYGLFARLANLHPPVPAGIRYKMHSEDVVKMQNLEDVLVDVCWFLWKRAGLNTAIQYLWLPSSVGMEKSYREPEGVERCKSRVQTSFMFLMAACSFAVALNTTEYDLKHPDEEPAWARASREVKQPNPLNPHWLAAFRSSIVCDFTPGLRAGVFIDSASSQWACAFPAFARANISFWVHWGVDAHGFLDNKFMKLYQPNAQIVRIAQKRKLEVPETQEPDSKAPIPFTGSYQQRGETYSQFHTRVAQEVSDFAKYEEQSEKEQREAWTKQADAENSNPLTQSPTVGLAMFEWVWYGPYILRRLVSHREWAVVWKSASPEQRHYLPHLNQWDIEPASVGQFGVGSAQNYDSYFGGDDDDDDFGGNDNSGSIVPSSTSPISAPAPTPSQVAHTADYSSDVRDMFQDSPASIPLSQHALQSTADIICYRLGLSPENNSSTRLNDYVPSSHYCEQADWALFRMGLRNCPEFIGKPENHSREENELKDFLHKIFNYVTSQGKAKLFAPTFDYGPSMYNKVTGNSYWRVGVITLSKQASGPSLWQNRDINVLGISSQPLVDQWYLVGLWDSAAVLQLFRMSFVNEMSVLGAVRELIQWGIPFLTLKPSANYPTKAHQRPEVGVGLGFRSRGHRFDESELAAYETAKKDLLSTSVGRLALMKGGIIWRLAKDLVPVKSVVKGPPPSVRTSGVSFGKLKGSFLCDEVLEESEEDIIVGLYKVESGISGQNADLSWWPKPSAWSVGNRNFGYWTPDCEKFYQDRLREIRLGKARPRSATEWHQTLERSALSVSAFHGSLDHAAMQLLDNQLDSYWVQ
ncbi:hypothetical protein VKT23_020676 [Stygiomarasmius scandens]|uniref:Uncharacterized protein n=1 Tax=Marasmiellus scandens TaxID=2682957 RepID=A0ABR1IIL1_9AGAR